MAGFVELILVVAVIYWLFNKRASTMVDVISARLQEAYVGWRQNSLARDEDAKEAIGGQRPVGIALRKVSTQKRRLNVEKDALKQARDANLYQIKELPTKMTAITVAARPLMGMCCSRCTPGSRESLVSNAQKRQNVINILNFGRNHDEKTGFFAKTFCDFVQAYRVRKYDYKEVSKAVLNDDRLKEAVEQVTQETLAKYEDQKNDDSNQDKAIVKATYASVNKSDNNRAVKIVENMRSALSDFLLRLTSWTLYKLLPYFISSIAACPTQIDMLKKAGDSGLPLIFVPLHRSHLDYILVTFILLNNNIRCPLVAAGDNLKIPLFGWLLRGLGAFYIKRRLDTNGSEKDIIYRAALHTYIMNCLQAQHNIEFYIEGGRSRTGKPLLPKGGILSVIVDAYLDGTVEDALLVPVSMNYDKLVDGNFVREQSGMPKQMESFTVAMKSIWNILNSHYGNIRIDFNQPFSIKELVTTFQHSSRSPSAPFLKSPSNGQFNFMRDNGPISIKKLSMERCLSSRQSCSSLYGTDVVVEEQRGIVEAIARHLVYDSSEATAIMSTNAVAFLLLTKYRSGCSMDTLVDAFSKLTTELQSSNRDVGFSGEPIDVVNHAINLLGTGLITKKKNINETIVRPVLIQPNIIELCYYSNCLLPHYAIQSIIVTAVQSIVTSAKVSLIDYRIRHSELVDVSLQLCEIMSQEFILCKPCQKLENMIDEGIEQLVAKDVLRSVQGAHTDNKMWVRNFTNTTDDEIFNDEYRPLRDPEYAINIEDNAKFCRFQLQTVLRPLLEAYCMTTYCLPNILLPENGISEADLVKEIRIELKDALDRGDSKYGEAMSVDAIKNCLRLLRQWGVLEAHSQGRLRMLYITKEYRNEQTLASIHGLFAKFKTEIPQTISPICLKR